MKRLSLLTLIFAFSCASKDDAINDSELNLDSCEASIGAAVPDFFANYFACTDLSVSGDNVVLWTDGLPPTPSAYYPSGDPNYVEYDDRDGDWHKNPNTLDIQDFEISISMDPSPKGITINDAMVDNSMNTSDEEYSGGGQGVALNGVIAFAAMAAPGDDLADEQYTFDMYEGHPAGTTYHYHFNTPGPLEVLVDRGYSDSSTMGAGSVEMYGIMCDGTVVMGCTELDRSDPNDSDFDAQNGHVHDIRDATDTLLTDRYHTHVCPSEWPDYPFFPEIAYYDQGSCGVGGP